jgi:hypothetical protein
MLSNRKIIYLGRLGLDALSRINDENHHVNYLGTPNYRADKRCVTRTIHQRVLQLIVREF